ncbi:MAG: rhodanese-like domain-containing protein [Bacteroidetes bacterium]|nr:rhodanese-like domain-containing protein [Bacteroidota bacterium]
MKKIIILILLFACTEKKSGQILSPEQFNLKLKSTPNATLIDVRTEEEWKGGFIAGAQNIVYDDSFAEKLEALPKKAPIFVYCSKGKRSEKAARILKAKGFNEIYQLEGGIDAWKDANLPL